MPTLIEPNQFVHGKATEINSNNVVVTLNNGNNTTVTIAFDHLIIATGADYRSPITPTDDNLNDRYFDDTWLFHRASSTTWKWTLLSTQMAGRKAHAMAATTNGVVLFGGLAAYQMGT